MACIRVLCLCCFLFCLTGVAFAQERKVQAAPAEAGAAPGSTLFALCVNDLCGYVNERGAWVIPPKFNAANPFMDDGLAWVKYGGKLGRINIAGEWASPLLFDRVDVTDDEELFPASVDGKWGYINVRGEWAIQPIFDDPTWGFIGEYALAYTEEKGYVAVNRQGQILELPVPLTSDSAFVDGVAYTEVEGQKGFINTKGEWVVKPGLDICSTLHEGLALVRRDGKYGFIDSQGRWIHEPVFDGPSYPSEGMVRISKNGKVGYMDIQGKVVIEPQYDEGGHFSDGLALVHSNGEKFYIDKQGKTVLSIDKDYYPESFSEGLAPVYDGSGYGCIDKEGNWVIEPRAFEDIGRFTGGVAPARQLGLWGMINRQGQWVEPARHESLYMESNGLAVGYDSRVDVDSTGVVVNWDEYEKKRYVIDNTGTYRVPVAFRAPAGSSGPRLSFADNERRVLDAKGNTLLVIENVNVDVVKNAEGAVVWPRTIEDLPDPDGP